ncbi:hypothetical protein RB195_004357 [Necator americanus]|uniref:Peptidase M12A domain-containing protein n=1 Tax=Necator americanus TaxID=51031 RepID=A0ABR1BLJ6_NECAM
MVANDAKYTETLGSPFISFYDILMLKKHYEKCNLHQVTSAKCEMGGFPYPRKCSRCICPSGYGGRLCNEKPSGGGSVLEAKSEYKTPSDKVGDFRVGLRPREDMTTCNYWIKAPVGLRIEVKIADLSRSLAVDGCTYWGVEIKTHTDQRLTGYRIYERVSSMYLWGPPDVLLLSTQISLIPIHQHWRNERLASHKTGFKPSIDRIVTAEGLTDYATASLGDWRL